VAEVLRAAEECHGVKESLAVAPGNAASINP
jgi:hypothetical protein